MHINFDANNTKQKEIIDQMRPGEIRNFWKKSEKMGQV